MCWLQDSRSVFAAASLTFWTSCVTQDVVFHRYESLVLFLFSSASLHTSLLLLHALSLCLLPLSFSHLLSCTPLASHACFTLSQFFPSNRSTVDSLPLLLLFLFYPLHQSWLSGSTWRSIWTATSSSASTPYIRSPQSWVGVVPGCAAPSMSTRWSATCTHCWLTAHALG